MRREAHNARFDQARSVRTKQLVWDGGIKHTFLQKIVRCVIKSIRHPSFSRWATQITSPCMQGIPEEARPLRSMPRYSSSVQNSPRPKSPHIKRHGDQKEDGTDDVRTLSVHAQEYAARDECYDGRDPRREVEPPPEKQAYNVGDDGQNGAYPGLNFGWGGGGMWSTQRPPMTSGQNLSERKDFAHTRRWGVHGEQKRQLAPLPRKVWGRFRTDFFEQLAAAACFIGGGFLCVSLKRSFVRLEHDAERTNATTGHDSLLSRATQDHAELVAVASSRFPIWHRWPFEATSKRSRFSRCR